MKLINLFELIQQTLSTAGFKPVSFFKNSMISSYWVLDNELAKVRLTDGWQVDVVSGLCLAVSVVPHGNQADEDTSYYLKIQQWERSSSKTLEKFKVSKNSSERWIIRKVTEFLAVYQKIYTEWRINKLIEGSKK